MAAPPGHDERETGATRLAEVSALLAEMNDAVMVLAGHAQILAQGAGPEPEAEIARALERYRRCVAGLTEVLSRWP